MTSTSFATLVGGSGLSAEPSVLKPHEVFWRNHYEWLREKGYELRGRYKPGWTPSTQAARKRSGASIRNGSAANGNVLNATRISDGRAVALKKLSSHTGTQKLEVHEYLATWPLDSHPKNHSVPILDVLEVPNEPEAARILVMPWLQSFNEPSVQTVGEALDFLSQVFEGVQFMHRCNIAHHNSKLNIMLDSNPLYSSGVRHSVSKHHKRTASHSGSTRRYYLTDFGESQKYEYSSRFRNTSYDSTVSDPLAPTDLDYPFAADIYSLGQMISRTFLETTSTGLEFLAPLISDMTQSDPMQRPDIDEVVTRFKKLKAHLHWWMLRSRLVRKDERGLPRLQRSMAHVFRTMGYIMTRRPAIPSST